MTDQPRDARGRFLPKTPWRVGRWKQRPHFCCRFCSYDTLAKELMREHARIAHGGPEARR